MELNSARPKSSSGIKDITMIEDNYNRIKTAIEYMSLSHREQPSLEELSNLVNLSPAHFQRIFTEWAGVSPKKFLQSLNLNHAKELLAHGNTLLDTSIQVGLSGAGRLHDLFIQVERMTPGEYKVGARGLEIEYGYYRTPLGEVLIASTNRGVCHLSFAADKVKSLKELQSEFSEAEFVHKNNLHHQSALGVFQWDSNQNGKVKVHLRGSDFQLKVWQALLQIPAGRLSSYQEISHAIGKPNASRATGSAIGKNPIAYLIPCHRVIRSSGALGGYRWGLTKKSTILAWERAQTESYTID